MCLDFLWFSHKFLILKATRPGTVAEFRRLRPFTLVLRWMPWALGPRPLRCWSAPENLAQQILRPDRLWHTNFGYLWIMKSVILCWVLHQYSWNLFFSVFCFRWYCCVPYLGIVNCCDMLWYITPHLNPYELPKVGQNVFPRLQTFWTMCTERSSLREASADLLTSCLTMFQPFFHPKNHQISSISLRFSQMFCSHVAQVVINSAINCCAKVGAWPVALHLLQIGGSPDVISCLAALDAYGIWKFMGWVIWISITP